MYLCTLNYVLCGQTYFPIDAVMLNVPGLHKLKIIRNHRQLTCPTAQIRRCVLIRMWDFFFEIT